MKQIRSITNAEFTYDRENLETGIYFYRLSNEFGKTYSGKVLVH